MAVILVLSPGLGTAENANSRSVNVSTIKAVASTSYASTRHYAGSVVAGRISELGFKDSGALASISVDVGDRVAAGEQLAALESASQQAKIQEAIAMVSVAQAQIAALRADAELALQTERRFANLRETGHVSAQQYDEQRLNLQAKQAQLQVARATLQAAQAKTRAAKVALAEANIIAPYAGVVQARYVDQGSQVTPGQPVLRLVEVGNKEAHVGIPAPQISALEMGTTHRLRWGHREIPATLTALLPEIDPASRTLTAVYRLTDEASQALPIGAVVELVLASQINEAGFWVPLTALTESDRGLWGVYVVGSEHTVERRLVEVVHAENQQAFVRGTLTAGEEIVATGVQRLVPGQKVSRVGRSAS